jgi:XTP/dITP diphosphohydrolase
MQILLASTNQGKIAEFQKLVGKLPIIAPHDASLAHKTVPTVIEDGETYFENALKKAIAFHNTYGMPVLTDDSGLEVDALNGVPGVHSAYYGGKDLTWPQRWQHLYAALAKVPQHRWTARFRCVLCFYEGKRVPYFFQGTVEGRISPAPAGKQGFGYDPIFYSNELGLTFGEASTEEKDGLSHRAEAVKAFLAWWKLDQA